MQESMGEGQDGVDALIWLTKEETAKLNEEMRAKSLALAALIRGRTIKSVEVAGGDEGQCWFSMTLYPIGLETADIEVCVFPDDEGNVTAWRVGDDGLIEDPELVSISLGVQCLS